MSTEKIKGLEHEFVTLDEVEEMIDKHWDKLCMSNGSVIRFAPAPREHGKIRHVSLGTEFDFNHGTKFWFNELKRYTYQNTNTAITQPQCAKIIKSDTTDMKQSAEHREMQSIKRSVLGPKQSRW